MKNHRWTIHEGTRCIDTGTVIAESERDAMREVMSRGSELPIEMDKCYRITVGDTTMSSYGDEFIRSAEVTGWGDDAEQENLQGRHLFPSPEHEGFATGGIVDGCKLPLGAGSDAIIGRALNNGSGGDVIEVELMPGPYGGGGGVYRGPAADRIDINSPVRIGASGSVHPPATPSWDTMRRLYSFEIPGKGTFHISETLLYSQ